MTLPGSGPLTRTQIRTEFGLASSAIWPDDYFGKGGAPSARPLKYSDFHGRSSAPIFDFAPGDYTGDTSGTWTDNLGPSEAGITIHSNIVVPWTYTITGTGLSSTSYSPAPSGASASSFSVFMGNSTTTAKSIDVTVSCTYNGVTYNWAFHFVASRAGGA